MAAIPAIVETHLDAVQCSPGGRIFLGSSNLTGRYWNGSLWCFKDVDDTPDVEKCLAGIEVNAGICDLVCLDEDKVAVGLDSGTVSIYQLSSDPPLFTQEYSSCEHDDYVSSLSLNSDKSKLMSASADQCVKVWDLESFSTVQTYRPVHAGAIWQVACSTVDPQIFVTCGQDGKILLFDRRLAKPVTIIDPSPLKSETTSVAWNPLKPDLIAVGDESGHIAIKDITKNATLCSWDAHKRRVYRIVFSSSQPWLVSCSDDTDVSVMNIKKDTSVSMYQNNDHEDFVRGLAWSKENNFISCAWDKRVLNHIVVNVS